ncbi:hypothetical protein COY52_12760 [Candidatus Desantisbacteria bacterium CG_4_10_14_0_8_um_filter_48_22]|uniref:Uroporphyrinogen decarboxylase (URO-D) domain-containing protein n=1 Tax=Candidatus Desantisbacteria bacterium CG_4_10_14_0_8_um_filter_48_22 TaxID=1974543 RepID=A0A2M7S494_9BACT|nr:MAG: hypothetical protein COS16_01885 [Candidatus Desantisbacteria bacterium CG02_land_8_20_14_3_00_49_13]PIZ14401.1 MAG: hypothetical protein COY52_12760 [Candidatus Desantisbacteria bacterium CG_4_10_14_0_8_um_filter_48_22]PJB27283.1 MAG: hypothetical protein CO111_06160 [Candidatus Desantisbacteria bacterium CG_4_9_14_3_um_filter_50_7]
MSRDDVKIVRELAARAAEIAALPAQNEKKALWRKLNARAPARPMVMIDQVCWNEMNTGEELTLKSADGECRGYELYLRRTLYQWKHFPVDMVVEPFIPVPKAIGNSGFGIGVQEETLATDPGRDVISHKFENQFQTEADLEKIKKPRITHDPAETERRLAVAHELFDGLLEVRPWGMDPWCMSLWDPISTWMGVENALYALVDRPEYMHKLVGRVTEGYLAMLDQLEEQGLLCETQGLIHCTGAYTDELPAPGFNPKKPRTKDLWVAGLAQMFSTVSPKMFKEFEVDYASRYCARFGLVYYGCCDPLDGKMAEVRMIPNVRKVSMSPWTNQERGASGIGRDFVFSRKPNPAFVAMERFDPEVVRADLIATRTVCEKHGCPLEFILKDVSTVRYQPERLSAWARIAMEVVGG